MRRIYNTEATRFYNANIRAENIFTIVCSLAVKFLTSNQHINGIKNNIPMPKLISLFKLFKPKTFLLRLAYSTKRSSRH